MSIPEALKKTRLWRFARVVYGSMFNYYLLKKPVPVNCPEKETVFVLVYSLYGGGAERIACILASALSENYHVVLGYLQEKEKSYPVSESVELIHVPRFGGEAKKRDRLRAEYVRRLKASRNTVASVSLMFTMNRINVLSRGTEKVICSERNSPAKREPERMPMIREIYAQADHVVFQSALVRDLFDEKVRAHSTILPNPVAVSCRRGTSTKHRIVNIGRLTPQKNQAMLIRTFARFSERHPEYTLSFYGEGELLPDLKKLVRKLKIQERVLFHGNTEQIHEAVSDAEMFVLSSNFEGMSNALLECMMMGMPCISTACEGSVDVIRDGENGLLTEVGNEEQLLQAMLRLAEEEDFREGLGKAAAETAERFRREDVVQQWIQLVQTLTGGQKRPSEGGYEKEYF